MSERRPPRDLVRRLEVERMFAELVRDTGVNPDDMRYRDDETRRDVVGVLHFDDEYSGHARYLPPWTTEVDGIRAEYGPRTAGAWTKAWEDWNLRPYWRPPEQAAVRESLASRQAAITELASVLLPRLTPAEAEVYRLHYVAGHSINQIARLTRRHRGSVTRHLGSLKAKAVAVAGGSR